MDDVKPPSYNAGLQEGVTASAPSINEEFSQSAVGASGFTSGVDKLPEKYDGGISASAPQNNEGYQPDYDYIKPPTAPPPIYTDTPLIEIPRFDTLTNEEIRNACYEYVADTCCYGSRATRDMIHTSVNNISSLHYKLETFGEKRQSADRTTPYFGQTIDGPQNGPPPTPWDVSIYRGPTFQDGKLLVEIPHTAYVKECGRCNGRGKVNCSSCSGDGWNRCFSCSGSGRVYDSNNSNYKSCTSCGGRGRNRCWTCSGSGRVKCTRCNGHGRLKHFKELIVTWKNHIEDFVSNTSNLPSELMLSATGREVFRKESPAVPPLSHSSDAFVNDASHQLIAKHQRIFTDELILRQRHTIRAIPITRVTYYWRGKEGEFYVYSFENKVYFKDYPQKCCCCICC